MRKIASLFVLFAVLTITASAQQSKVAEKQSAINQPVATIDRATFDSNAKMVTDEMDKSLALTKEQHEKVFQINKHLVELEARLKADGRMSEKYQRDIISEKLRLILPVLDEKQAYKFRREVGK